MGGIFWLGLLVACRGDTTISEQLFEPEVVWVSPAQDGQLAFGAEQTLTVGVTWRSGALEGLSYGFTSDLDGALPGTMVLDPTGQLDWTIAGGLLRVGDHQLTVTAFDERAGSAEATVSVQVVPDLPPSVNLSDPDPSLTWYSTEPVRVRGLVDDADEANLADLSLAWSGTAPGLVALPESPDSTGEIDGWLSPMPAGNYVLSVRATDTLGATGSASLAFRILPSDADGDGAFAASDGGTDCDDNDFEVNPSAHEACNGRDDDCDGDVDEDDAVDALAWFPDNDADSFGSSEPVFACDAPAGHAADSGDCDDANAEVSPDAEESCNEVDDDCNGLVDDDPVDGQALFADLDLDGWGDGANPRGACPGAADATDRIGDCDDAVSEVNPEHGEVCGNQRDDDCDGGVDEDCIIEHCGAITLPELWLPGNVHLITCEVQVHSTLTLADGVQIQFAATGNPSPSIQVAKSAPGRVLARGSSVGIVAEPVDPVGFSGWWSFGARDSGSELAGMTIRRTALNRAAVTIDGASVTLTDVDVEESRGIQYAAIQVLGGGDLSLTDSVVHDGWQDGVSVAVGSTLSEFTNNTVVGQVGLPLRLPFSQVDVLSGADALTGNGNDLVELIGDRLEHDATLRRLDADYSLVGLATVAHPRAPRLNIAPGVVVYANSTGGIDIGTDAPGGLDIDATGDPVRFGPADEDAAPGSWPGLRFQSHASESTLRGLVLDRAGLNRTGALVHAGRDRLRLEEVEIYDSGAAGLDVATSNGASAAVLSVDGLLIDGARDEGVLTSAYATLESLANTRVANSSLALMRLSVQAVGALDDTLDLGPGADRAIEVHRGTVTRSATWSPRDGSEGIGSVPYRFIGGTVSVASGVGPVLTLADGVEIVGMNPNWGLAVATGTQPGGLVVDGHTEGVVMRKGDEVEAWGGLSFSRRTLPESSVVGLDLSGARDGGLTVSVNGHVTVTDSVIHDNIGPGVSLTHSSTLSLTDSVLTANGGFGLDTLNGDLVEFARNDLSGNVLGPANVPPHVVGQLDADSTYGDPAFDRVVVGAYITTLGRSATWRDLGVPYVLERGLTVNASILVTLEIEAGTTIEFAGGSVYCGRAKIQMLGTADAPVRLVGATGTPGDWQGLYARSSYCQELRLEHVELRDAGAERLVGTVVQTPVALRYGIPVTGNNVLIASSAGWGAAAEGPAGALNITDLSFEGNALGEVAP